MLTAVLATLSLAALGQDTAAPIGLGFYDIGASRAVAAEVIPTSKTELLGTSVKFGEDTYVVDGQGRVVARVRGNGSWSDFAERAQKAKARQSPSNPAWRIKAFVLTRSDLLETHADGMLRARQGSLESPQLQRTLSALSLLAALIETTTDGALRPQIELQIDADSAPENAYAGSKPYGSAFLTEYLEARINGAGYIAEDRAYRGPYDSIFVIHSGLVQDTARAVVNDSPSWSLPYYSPDCGGTAQEMAAYLFSLWNRDVLSALSKHGYATPTDADFLGPEESLRVRGMAPVPAMIYAMPPGGWGKLTSRVEPKSADYAAHATKTYQAEGKAWADVRTSPLDHLPWLQGRVELNRTLGLSSAWSNEVGVKPYTQASFTLGHGSDQYVFVDLPFADLFGSHFASAAKARVLALYGDPVFKRIYVVFKTAKFGDNLPEVSLLTLPGFSFGPDVVAAPPAEVPVIGNVIASREKDAEHGDVWRLDLKPNPWIARLDLVPAGAKIDLVANPFLNLALRATEVEPWTIGLYTQGASRPSARISLFMALPEPVETAGSERIPTKYVPGMVKTDWNKVSIDLRQILDATTLSRITQIRIETDPRTSCFEPIQPAATLRIAKPTLSASATANDLQAVPGLPDPNATDANPLARLSYILRTRNWTDATAQANLLKLLEDTDDTVRLNACNVFTRFTLAGSEATLGKAVRSISTRIADVAIKALAFQNTPEAWLILGSALENGPFEFTKASAAKMLATRKDPKLAGTINRLYASNDWRVRRAGVEALQSLPNNEPAVAAMAFLQEEDPSVRLAVVRGVTLPLDVIMRRLLWNAVNDSSDMVRLWSNIGLIRFGKPKEMSEGYKGVRDDSRIVRLRLVQYIEKHPIEAARDALRLAIADVDPEVRAAALDAFIKMPDPFRIEDVQSASTDTDPRVKAAYQRLLKARGLA
ncbi:MAG: HEAT repeat domain-containing protein [Fimbriimonadaceae bacterium]|nr:HEAT repeat domain-containing protein [Fimbriimonadaceae bacterium]